MASPTDATKGARGLVAPRSARETLSDDSSHRGESALARLHPLVGLVDHIGPAATTDHAVVAVTVLERLEAVANLHGTTLEKSSTEKIDCKRNGTAEQPAMPASLPRYLVTKALKSSIADASTGAAHATRRATGHALPGPCVIAMPDPVSRPNSSTIARGCPPP